MGIENLDTLFDKDSETDVDNPSEEAVTLFEEDEDPLSLIGDEVEDDA